MVYPEPLKMVIMPLATSSAVVLKMYRYLCRLDLVKGPIRSNTILSKGMVKVKVTVRGALAVWLG